MNSRKVEVIESDLRHMTSSGKKYKFIQNKHLIISSFFDNLEATLESVDDVNNVYELKLNYHVPLYWRGTKQMFKDNWQEI